MDEKTESKIIEIIKNKVDEASEEELKESLEIVNKKLAEFDEETHNG